MKKVLTENENFIVFAEYTNGIVTNYQVQNKETKMEKDFDLDIMAALECDNI